MAAEIPVAVFEETILTGRLPDNSLDPDVAGLDRITTEDWYVGRHQGISGFEYGHLTDNIVTPPITRELIICRYFRNANLDLDRLVVFGEITNAASGTHVWEYNKSGAGWVVFVLGGGLASWFGGTAGLFALDISDVIDNWISVRLTVNADPVNFSNGVRVFTAGAWLENSTLQVLV
jgi:hypothetical protein